MLTKHYISAKYCIPKSTLLFTGILMFSWACSVLPLKKSGKSTIPAPNEIKIEGLCLDAYSDSQIVILQRYLKGNPRWDFRSERGMKFAYLLPPDCKQLLPDLKGYFWDNANNKPLAKNRIVISFGQHLGYAGQDDVSFTDYKDKILKVNIFADAKANNQATSCIVIKASKLNIEIFEQNNPSPLEFTRKAITEINKELLMVLENLEIINKKGIVKDTMYKGNMPDSLFFQVNPGHEPGIYFINAAYNATIEGKMYVKLIDIVNNRQISKKIITPMTEREPGWNEDGEFFFNYFSNLVIYDSFNDKNFDARFELWFKNKDNTEIRIAKCEKVVQAWERH